RNAAGANRDVLGAVYVVDTGKIAETVVASVYASTARPARQRDSRGASDALRLRAERSVRRGDLRDVEGAVRTPRQQEVAAARERDRLCRSRTHDLRRVAVADSRATRERYVAATVDGDRLIALRADPRVVIAAAAAASSEVDSARADRDVLIPGRPD